MDVCIYVLIAAPKQLQYLLLSKTAKVQFSTDRAMVSRMSNNNDVFKELLNSTQEMVRNQQQTNNLQSKMLQAVSN